MSGPPGPIPNFGHPDASDPVDDESMDDVQSSSPILIVEPDDEDDSEDEEEEDRDPAIDADADGEADEDGDEDDEGDEEEEGDDDEEENEDGDDDNDEEEDMLDQETGGVPAQPDRPSTLSNNSEIASSSTNAGTAPTFSFGMQPPPPAPTVTDAAFTGTIPSAFSALPQPPSNDLFSDLIVQDPSGLADLASASAAAMNQIQVSQADLDQVQSQADARIAAVQAELETKLAAAQQTHATELAQARAEGQQQVNAVRAEANTVNELLSLERVEKEALQARFQDITNQLTESRQRTEDLEREKAEVAAAAAAAELGQLPDGSDAAVGAPQAVISSLRIQLKSTASSNRELLRALEREKTEARSAENRAYNLNIKLRETQNEVTRLLSEVQGLKNADSSRNFKLVSVSQELELSKKELDFVRNELGKLQQSSTQFRTSRTLEVSRLQNALSDAESQVTGLKTKVNSLNTAYEKGIAKQKDLLERAEDAERQRAEEEAAFKGEMETQIHLASLYEQRANDAERRAKAVETQWEDIQRGWKDREEQARARLVEESHKREAAEKERDELKVALDRLAEGVGIPLETETIDAIGARFADRAASAEPNSQAGGLLSSIFGNRARSSTPAGPVLSAVTASPSAQLASRLQKNGKSFTQVYHELAVTTEELRREREEHRKKSELLSEVSAEALQNAARAKAEHDDAAQATRQLEALNREFSLVCTESQQREKAVKQAQAELARVARENALLENQVIDQGRQIRALMKETILRDDPDAADRLEDDGTDLSDLSRTDSTAVSQDTNSVITANLVTFRSLTEIVTQNQRLLLMTRELATQLESRERDLAAGGFSSNGNAAGGLDAAELEELRTTLDRLEEQLRAERSSKKALTAERDLLKARLQRADGTAGPNGSLANGSSAPVGPDAALIQAHDLLRLEHERLQRHYDTYRTETAEDLRQLKEDASDSRREASKAAAKAAKEKALRAAADERYDMMQQTYELQRDELQELQKQTQNLRNSLTKTEISLQAMDSTLGDTRAHLELARNEAANARAERDLAKSMEKRLMEEHRGLMLERSSLTQLLQQVQTMQLDLEKAGSQNRERLEAQVHTLEQNVKELKDRLAKEENDHRAAVLRREVDAREAQTRLDAANAELLDAKKQLVDTNGKLQQLSTKHDELAKDLQLHVEKLAVYERQANEDGDDGVSKEKRLETELAEVRSSLKTMAVELEASRTHVEQYKNIAQGAEDATEQLQATLEEAKKDAAEQVAAKDADMASLKQRMSTFIDELNKAQEEAADLKKQLAAQNAEFNSQKRELEDALTQLTGAEEAAAAREKPIRSDRDRQAQLAEEAERKYQSELLSHARDVEELHRIRDQLQTAQTDKREALKAKETAEVKLSGSEASWIAQKEAIQREADELKKNIEDLKKQNSLLHDALESANEQATKLRQAHAESRSDNFDPDQSVSAIPPTELNEVVRFLRKEKEIVDVQLELSRQEAARLRQSLDHANAAIDKLRSELAEERGKVVAASTNSAQQQDLLEKVQQVNLLRESNATLRQETQRARTRISNLEEQLRKAQTELQPVRERATMAEAELESSREQAKILEEDSKRWQARVQNILAQYNQQDPEEIRTLKEQAAKVDELLATNQQLTEAVAQANASTETAKGRFDRLRTQTVERLQAKSAEIEALKQDFAGKEQAHTDALAALQSKLEAASSSADKDAIAKAIAESQTKWDEEKRKLDQRNEEHLAKAKEFLAGKRAAEKATAEANAKLAELQKDIDNLRAGNSAEVEKAVAEKLAEYKKSAEEGGQLDEADSNLLSLQERVAEQEESLKQAQARIAELEAALAAAGSGGATTEGTADHSAELEALKAQHLQELAKVRTEATASAIEKQRELEAQIAKLRDGHSATEDDPGPGGATQKVDPEKIEEEVQKRLSALETEREAAQAAAIKLAVESQLKDAAEKHKTELQDAVERGKTEANLRNQLHLSKRDKQIANLQEELNKLKAESSETKTEDAGVETVAANPAGTGAAASRPLQGTSIAGAGRGGRSIRGNAIAGRGGAAGAAAAAANQDVPTGPAGAAKRKASTAEDSGNTTERAPAKRARGGRGGGRGGKGGA
ncbi:Protein mlp1 [Tilletia horrida]|uniref:Protein mlp1 n=1 Tax=Tilletia horrida TaxID=155126 RepID=A0AAN6GV21_9BASI|nr:Protein mlp1 [Tilletia horrida]KAK0556853.1 Protein mlp1 [Tilletia horrida]KAK0569213.1 Protein mlp1 [Tilletia horrida]